MIAAVAAFVRLLRQAPRRDLARLVALLLAANLTEGVGLFLIVPLLAALTGEGASTGAAVFAASGAGAGLGGIGRRALAAVQHAGLPGGLAGLLLAFVVLVGLRGAIEVARDRVVTDVQLRLVDRLRARCLDTLLHAEWRWLTATRRAHHANQLLVDINRVGMALHYGMGFLVALAGIAAYVAVALILAPAAAALALGGGALLLLPLAALRSHAVALGTELTRAARALHVSIDATLGALKLAKLHGREAAQVRHLEDAAGDLRTHQLAFVRRSGVVRAAFQTGGAVLLAGFVYAGLGSGRLPVPQLLALALIFARLAPMVVGAQRQLQHWLHDMAAVHETERLLAESAAAAEPVSQCATTSAVRLPAGEIALRDVRVVHAGGRAALDGVSLVLPPGSVTAITGASGAGKSTLADTLVGLLAPDAGALIVGDTTVGSGERRAWRGEVAYVPQETVLFHDTVRANLLWAAPQADEAALDEALTKAAAGFVRALPHGLETIVGDAGCRLSGGERQRLGLARALLGAPRLLVLDEATSALDPANEARVFATLAALKGRLTIVIIGHRLPVLDFVDRQVRLEAGRVIER